MPPDARDQEIRELKETLTTLRISFETFVTEVRLGQQINEKRADRLQEDFTRADDRHRSFEARLAENFTIDSRQDTWIGVQEKRIGENWFDRVIHAVQVADKLKFLWRTLWVAFVAWVTVWLTYLGGLERILDRFVPLPIRDKQEQVEPREAQPDTLSEEEVTPLQSEPPAESEGT